MKNRIKNIAKFISFTGIGLSLFAVIPLLSGIIYGEDYLPFTYCTLLFFIGNFVVYYSVRSHTMNLDIRDSIVAVNIVWIFLGIAGAVPFILYGAASFSDAFFEAISGFTTTGATVFSDIEALPKMLLMHRSLMHWLGGMGIIVLGVALFSLINPSGSLSLFKAESTGITLDKVTPRIKDTASRLWGVYLLLTAVDGVLLYGFGMEPFDAINHAFSTISTGGFSTKNSSLGFYHSDMIIWTTTLFMLLSGINFLAHFRAMKGDMSGFRASETKVYLLLFLLFSLMAALPHYTDGKETFYAVMMHGMFTIASILTTTGFSTVDYETWGVVSLSGVILAMLIGGNTGSTAGGVKVIRYIILFKNIAIEMKKIITPSIVTSIFLDGRRLKENVALATFGFFSLYMLTVGVVVVYLYARGYDGGAAFSTALAIVGNIGPGLGLTGPSHNYGFFAWYDKLFLSFAMVVGRLECYTVFILFTKAFWKRF